jgi:mono/diheme cytochrome c family protein
VSTRRHVSLILLLILLAAGCEGARNNSSWSTAKAGDPIVPVLTKSNAKEDALSTTGVTAEATAEAVSGETSGRGVGPVAKVDIASLDAARALAGSQLFTAKCSACHKINERYIGPALIGVTKRRQPEWICNMILNPENMIQQDPTAKALLAQYLAPMANQHLSQNEAESILAFFLQNDAAMESAPAEAKPGSDTPPATQQ